MVEIAPDVPHYRSNLGLALFHRDLITEAIDQFEAAISLDPSSTVAQLMLGAALFDVNRYHEVHACYSCLVAPPMLTCIGVRVLPQGINHYRQVLASGIVLSPVEEAQIRASLSFGLASIGEPEESAACLAQGMDRIPALRLRHAVTMIPAVASSSASLAMWRRRTESAVDSTLRDLASQSVTVDGSVSPLDIGGDLGYWLTYQGGNCGCVCRSLDVLLSCLSATVGHERQVVTREDHENVFPCVPDVAPRQSQLGW